MSKITRRYFLGTTSTGALLTGLAGGAQARPFPFGGVANGTTPLLPPAITSSLTLNATQNTPVFYQITATNSPTSFNATGLPTGLSVNTGTGVISGTPTVAAVTSVSISAINTAGTGSATLTITVSATLLPPTITSSLTVNGTQNSSFFYQIMATNSPTSFNATGLPGGLSVNTSNGQITGTPTTVATTSGLISAINSAGTGSATLTIIVSAASAGNTAALAALMVTDLNYRGNTVLNLGTGAPQAPNIYYAGEPNSPDQAKSVDGTFTSYAFQPTFNAGSFPTTMTLVQDGTIAGGVPTNTFGWCFRPGDIPAGHVPYFHQGGVPWLFSAGLQTYWPDGSLKWAAFSLMAPNGFTPALHAITTIGIQDGGAGSWPGASGRALTDIYNQHLTINAKTPSPAISGNTRSSDLFAAFVGDSNNYRATKYMDGAAGTCWKISVKFATSVGGTADPLLIGDAYVFVMNNASGGLGGFRWLGNIRSPLRSDQVGHDGEWVAFQPPSTGTPSAGLNWSVNPGGTPIYTPVQHPFNTVNFSNGGSFTGSTATNILTVTGAPTTFLMAGTTITADAPATDKTNITSISTPFAINFGGDGTLISPPPGITTDRSSAANLMLGLAYQISSSEPDGSMGKRGLYQNDNAHWSATFSSQTLIISSQMQPSYGTVGLYDGSGLTGQYHILGQLTASGGDAPGYRGTYLLSGSPGTVGSAAMTHYSTLTAQSDAPVNWYSGSSQGNRLYAQVSGSPPPISANWPPSGATYSNPMVTGVAGGLYSILGQGAGQNLSVDHNGLNQNWTGPTPGAATLTPIPAFVRNSRFQLATADGKYWFFRGTGSISADSTLRTQINQSYWQAAACTPPMDLTLLGTVPDTGYPYDWNPYNCGLCRSISIDDVGPPNEVGIFNSTAGVDFYAQTWLTEKENRIMGLYAGTTAADWTDSNSSTFDQVPPTYGTGTPYAGLPAAIQGSGPPQPSGIATTISDPTHEPDLGYWAFLRFGELQFFDYMVGWANLVTGYQAWYGATPTPYFPYATYGCVVAQGQNRGVAWANRDIQKVAFICSNDPTNSNPVFDYGGTQLAKYLIDHADDQPRMALAMSLHNNATLWGGVASAAYVVAHPGCFQPMYNSTVGYTSSFQPWEWTGYFYSGMMFAALRGNADATAIISNMMAWVDHIANHSIHAGDSGGNGYAHFYDINAFPYSQTIGQVFASTGNPMMTVDTQYSGTYATWTAPGGVTGWAPNTGGGSAFTMNGTLRASWWGGPPPNPQNNDAFTCLVGVGLVPVNDGTQWPPELTLNTTYYIRDLSPSNSPTGPWTFNLALSKGGAAIAISSSHTDSGIDFHANYVSSNPDQKNSHGPDYMRQVGATIFWLHAAATSNGPVDGTGNHGVNQFANFT